MTAPGSTLFAAAPTVPRVIVRAEPHVVSLRGSVAAALLFSAAAHAGALYWAVASTATNAETLSAGAAISVEVVMVEGPEAPAAGGAGGKADAGSGPGDTPSPTPPRPPLQATEAVADHAFSHDRSSGSAATAPGERPPFPAPTSFARAESPAAAAPHQAADATRETIRDNRTDQPAAPLPPPPKPALSPARPDRTPTASTEAAHAAAEAPLRASATVALAPAGAAGVPASSNGSDSWQAAAPHGDNPAPEYPFAARLRGQQGRVLLRVAVLSSGAVGTVAVERSSGYDSLDQAAVKAVRQWRFQPALRNGAPVAANIQVPIRFALK